MVSKYLARVELGNSYLVDYELVRHVMATSGFYKSDVNPEGVEEPLPRATYVAEGEFSIQEALDKVKLAISSTGYTGNIVVTLANVMLHDTVN